MPIELLGASAAEDGWMEAAASIDDPRLSPPQQRVHLIQRPALIKALEEGLSHKLILVQAPAGYGKTTLLAQWRDQLVDRGMRLCWLALV